MWSREGLGWSKSHTNRRTYGTAGSILGVSFPFFSPGLSDPPAKSGTARPKKARAKKSFAGPLRAKLWRAHDFGGRMKSIRHITCLSGWWVGPAARLSRLCPAFHSPNACWRCWRSFRCRSARACGVLRVRKCCAVTVLHANMTFVAVHVS